MDLVIEDFVVVELKAIEHILPIHEAQLLTYLRLSGKRIGVLMNFNVGTEEWNRAAYSVMPRWRRCDELVLRASVSPW